MITEISIDGFKSLQNFHLKIDNGLNILVGPNGVGKSNICQAISLLNHVKDGNISDYIISLGGTNSILPSEQCKEIKISVSGTDFNIDEEENYIDLKYKYEVVIEINEELIIASETINTTSKTKNSKRYKKLFSAKRVAPKGLEKTESIELTIHDHDNIGPSAEFISKYKDKKIRAPLKKGSSIFSFLDVALYYCYSLSKDFGEVNIVNIDPNRARTPCDITEGVNIANNGARLANSIYELYKDQELHEELNNIFTSIFPNFSSVSYKTEHNTRLIEVKDKNGKNIPTQSLSDGTIKILGLILHIITKRGGTIIIEEPENYLHPYAIETMLNKIKEKNNEFLFNTIITTHSETVLNLTSPDEIVICEQSNGITLARKITNIAAIREAIAETGFGCGYFYSRGALGGVPN